MRSLEEFVPISAGVVNYGPMLKVRFEYNGREHVMLISQEQLQKLIAPDPQYKFHRRTINHIKVENGND